MLKKREWGSWDDPLARATRGLRRLSLDARSWDHPTHPNKVTARCGLAWGKERLGAPGLGGFEKSGHFEHPVVISDTVPMGNITTGIA